MSLCHDLIAHASTSIVHGLNPSEEVIAACIQADATLRGSSRQATAALIAGAATLCAAGIAYWAATAELRKDEDKRLELSKIYPSILYRDVVRRMATLQQIIIIVEDGRTKSFKANFPLVDRSVAEKLSPPWSEAGYDLLLKLGPDLVLELQSLDFNSAVFLKVARFMAQMENLSSDKLQKSVQLFKDLEDQYSLVKKLILAEFPEVRVSEAHSALEETPSSEGEVLPVHAPL